MPGSILLRRMLPVAYEGTLKGCWVPHDTRDQIVDYIRHLTERAELPAKRLLS